jgi:hypothetical protein
MRDKYMSHYLIKNEIHLMIYRYTVFDDKVIIKRFVQEPNHNVLLTDRWWFKDFEKARDHYRTIRDIDRFTKPSDTQHKTLNVIMET